MSRLSIMIAIEQLQIELRTRNIEMDTMFLCPEDHKELCAPIFAHEVIQDIVSVTTNQGKEIKIVQLPKGATHSYAGTPVALIDRRYKMLPNPVEIDRTLPKANIKDRITRTAGIVSLKYHIPLTAYLNPDEIAEIEVMANSRISKEEKKRIEKLNAGPIIIGLRTPYGTIQIRPIEGDVASYLTFRLRNGTPDQVPLED